MGSVFFYFFYSIILFIFLAAAGIALVYFVMGINQLITGRKEESKLKTRAGWITAITSFGVLILLIFLFTLIIDRL